MVEARRRERRMRRSVLVSLLVAVAVLGAAANASRAAEGRPSPSRPATVPANATTWYLKNTLAAGVSDVRLSFGGPADAKLFGDWNGDGVRTPAAYNSGAWSLRNANSTGAADLTFAHGTASARPVAGDWNGDGIETVGYYESGCWHLRDGLSGGPSHHIFCFGSAAGVPVVGDWNGDGVDTGGYYESGCWHLRDSLSGGPSHHIFCFGSAAGVPVAGDWNGDGVDTGGYVEGGVWRLRDSLSGGPADRVFQYGIGTDAALTWRQAPTTVPPALVGIEWSVLPTPEKVVALTFDAGGNAQGVDSILTTLERTRTAGTFFLTGRWAELFPAQARRVATFYPVGNHSYSHPDLTTLTDTAVADQLKRAAAAITAATGQAVNPLFRFPFGARDTRTLGIANSLNYGSIRWTVDTQGWRGTSGGQSIDTVVRRVLDNLRPGAIVLMHVGSNPDDGSTLDADALPTIVSEVRSRGYRFVTVRMYA
jgi:peptidoglycan/xylan/chitin deacetylase (PgdA/CDA1 family)